MDDSIKQYLKEVDELITEKNMKVCLYTKKGNKLILLLNSNKRKEINDYLEKMEKDTEKLVIIQYVINTGKFLKGPINIICEIHKYVNGKRIEILSTTIFYLLEELVKRKFKWQDYKRIFNKLNKNLIPQTKSGKLSTISDVLKK